MIDGSEKHHRWLYIVWMLLKGALSQKSDQYLISPVNINMYSNTQVMRIREMISELDKKQILSTCNKYR